MDPNQDNQSQPIQPQMENMAPQQPQAQFQPEQPQQSSQPQPIAAPQFGSNPGETIMGQMQQPVYGAPMPQSKKINSKMIIIIVAIIAAIGIGIGVWLTFFNQIALREFSNEDFSIMVPKDYKEEDSFLGASFTVPNPKDEAYPSTIYVYSSSLYGTKKDKLSSIDEDFTKDKASESCPEEMFGTKVKCTNINLEKKTKGSLDYRIVNMDIVSSDKNEYLGKAVAANIVSDENSYLVAILSNKKDNDLLANTTGKIIDSLKPKN